jgi:two-component system chemotaxis response regulator CheB
MVVDDSAFMRRVISDLLSENKRVTNFTPQTKRQQQPKIDSQMVFSPKSQFALVAMGASTGGPGALEKVLTGLPANFPVPVIITQHMPAGFTKAFADRLDSLCKIRVKEAEHGETLQKGTAYIAPGGFHMVINSDTRIALNQDPPVEHVRPSVNVMLESAIKVYGGKIFGVILTGMGKDGADAMAALKKCGGKTVVQDESTSVIFSMPKAVIERKAADVIAPIHEIAGILVQSV